MDIINQTGKYPLYSYQISKFEFNRKDFDKMKRRVKRGKFNKLSERDSHWEYKFDKNKLHIIRKELGETMVLVSFEKEENKIIVKTVEVAPQMDTYIHFNGFAVVTFEEKIQIFLNRIFQLLQRDLFLRLSTVKFMGKRICVRLNIECPQKLLDALKDPILVEKCHIGRWFIKLRKNWIKFFYSYPTFLVGFLINAEIVKDKKNGKYMVKRLFIDPRIRHTSLDENDKKTTKEIAMDIVNWSFNEINFSQADKISLVKSRIERLIEILQMSIDDYHDQPNTFLNIVQYGVRDILVIKEELSINEKQFYKLQKIDQLMSDIRKQSLKESWTLKTMQEHNLWKEFRKLEEEAVLLFQKK